MITLLFAAVGVFFNPVTGDTQRAIAEVPSITACANLINDNRNPDGMETDKGTYYLIDAQCIVLEQK